MIACIDRLFLKVKRSLAPGRASPYELETHLVAVFRRQRVPQHPDRFEHPALRDQSGIERLEARLARGPCDELLRFRVVAPLEHGGPPFGKGGVSHDVEAGRIEDPQGTSFAHSAALPLIPKGPAAYDPLCFFWNDAVYGQRLPMWLPPQGGPRGHRALFGDD